MTISIIHREKSPQSRPMLRNSRECSGRVHALYVTERRSEDAQLVSVAAVCHRSSAVAAGEAAVISPTTLSQFCSVLRLCVQEATTGNSFCPGHCSHAGIYAFSCVSLLFPFVSSSVFGVPLAPTQVRQVVVGANA